MKSIGIFRSNAFDLSWPKEPTDPNTPPLGRDLAEHLKTRLTAIGLKASDPIEGSDYWVLDLEMDGGRTSLIIHWAPIGNPPIDYWVVQPQQKRSLLGNPFGKASASLQFEASCAALRRVLEEDGSIQNLEWLDEAEFKQRY
jgi:hypothetical protein